MPASLVSRKAGIFAALLFFVRGTARELEAFVIAAVQWAKRIMAKTHEAGRTSADTAVQT
jgi:hypothetical protein